MLHYSKGSEKPSLPKDGLRLYSMRFCPFAQRPRLVLAAKGVEFDCCNVNLKDKPDWFFDLNPNGTVPVIELQDGRVIYESVIVCEYLEEAFPQHSLFPRDLIEKNKQRVLINRFDKKFAPVTYKMIKDPSAKDELKKELEFYEKELTVRKSTYFGGENPGMLDYMIWPWFERLETNKTALEVFRGTELPSLHKWCEVMKMDLVVKACAFPTETYIEFYKLYVQGNPESQLIGVK